MATSVITPSKTGSIGKLVLTWLNILRMLCAFKAMGFHRLRATYKLSTRQQLSKTGDRLIFLDLARGAAVLAVLIEHGGYRFIPGFRHVTHDFMSFGKFGLALFFLVSGFVIPLSIERSANLKIFWVHRLFRLYPLYWLSLAAVLVLYGLGLNTELSSSFINHVVRNSFVNLFMLQEMIRVPHAIGLYYTLTIEMAFYLSCSVLVLLKLSKRFYVVSWVVLLVAASIWVSGPLLIHKRVEMAGLFYGVTLFVGTSVYRYYRGQVSAAAVSLLLLATGSLTSIGALLNYVTYEKNDPLEHYSLLAVLLPWGLAYALFVAGYLLRALAVPGVFIYLGTISYSIYLLHPLVLSLIADHDLKPSQPSEPLRFVIFIACTILLSSLTFYFVEQPMINLGRDLVRRPIEAPSSSLVEAKLRG